MSLTFFHCNLPTQLIEVVPPLGRPPSIYFSYIIWQMTSFDPKPKPGGAAGELPAVPGWLTRWKLAKNSMRIDLHIKVWEKVNKLSSCYDGAIPFFYSSFLLAFAKEEKHQFLRAVWVKFMLCELPTLYPQSLGTFNTLQGKKKVDIQWCCVLF